MAIPESIKALNCSSGWTKYSTDEQVVGKWIDGKPIYSIVVKNTTLTSVSDTNWVAYSILDNPDCLINFSFGRSDSGKRKDIITDVCGSISLGNLRILARSGTLNFPEGSFAIIQYTKTTD